MASSPNSQEPYRFSAPLFCPTRRTSALQMEKEGHKCTSIEGGMDKQARDKVVREFRCEVN